MRRIQSSSPSKGRLWAVSSARSLASLVVMREFCPRSWRFSNSARKTSSGAVLTFTGRRASTRTSVSHAR